jgi:AcrR family transcriptional regulator
MNRPYTMTARAEALSSTKDRIARAGLDLLLKHPYEEVTLAAIAAAAGVSHQTVLNHFKNKEGVVFGAAEVFRQQTEPARRAAKPGDLPGALRALIGEYERAGDVNVRWAVTSERVPELAQVLDKARAGHQEWIVEMFGAQLPTAPAARKRAIYAAHAATDVYTWKLLRRDLGLSRAETEKIMVDLLRGALKGADR